MTPMGKDCKWMVVGRGASGTSILLVLFSSLIVVAVGFGFYEIECLTRFIFLAVSRWARRWIGSLSILLNWLSWR